MTADRPQHGDAIAVVMEEHRGIHRSAEPVTVGVPLAKGYLKAASNAVLSDPGGRIVPLQCQVLARWADKSIKWLLLDFLVSIPAFGKRIYRLGRTDGGNRKGRAPGIWMKQDDSAKTIRIHTGPAVFTLASGRFNLFEQVAVGGIDRLDASRSRIELTGSDGRVYEPETGPLKVESIGPVRITLRANGCFKAAKGGRGPDFFSRLTFHAGSARVKVCFSLRNPNAAEHFGGLWDLGDAGAFDFKELTIRLGLIPAAGGDLFWTCGPGQPFGRSNGGSIEIYQDSSGGENWRSPNHVDRHGRVATAFRGYRVFDGKGGVIASGNRAEPEIRLEGGRGTVAAAVENFWQNFPKSLRGEPSLLVVGLFPGRCRSLFELQGGEQKSHTFHLNFAPGRERLDWVQEPLSVCVPFSHYRTTGVFGCLPGPDATQDTFFQSLIDQAIDEREGFAARREVIDEYGWRNFGDLFADHETHEKIDFNGDRPFVSHYNNQYDILYSALAQFARSGDRKWFQLARELAEHTIDIDIYHTDKDRAVFNHGYFWHTDHFADAATATHRSVSIATQKLRGLKSYGGGPGYEHNYTRGLLYYYLMTGEARARESVLELAGWNVCGIDDLMTFSERFEGMIKKCLAVVRNRFRKHPSPSPYRFDGPGRASGNSLNVMLDAFALTGKRFYLKKAEGLIQDCIHPRDDIAARDLLNPNVRWFYTIFLQALGHYLTVKADHNQTDAMFAYGRDSLLHYARWMLEHEYPFLTKPEQLDYPNFATRAAQDLRKCNVFLFASRYADGEFKKGLEERADFFFQAAEGYLAPLKTRHLTRPLAIVLQNSGMHPWFRACAPLPMAGPSAVHGPLPLPSGRLARLYRSALFTGFRREWAFVRFRIKSLLWARRN